MNTLRPDDPTTRLFLRHALATLAYRAGKTVRGTPDSFASFLASPDSKTPSQLVGHMTDLMVWCLCLVRDGEHRFVEVEELPWEAQVARLFAALEALDGHLATGGEIRWEPGRVFQGGIADALTHTGQLAMLRRLAGVKMMGENYSKAEIAVGRVGLDQAKPVREF